jgi:hypothetical protein
MDMIDPGAEVLDQADIVEAGRRCVSRVEQQSDRRASRGHERADLVERLGDHHQIMVIGECEAVLVEQRLGEARQPLAIGSPVLALQAPTARHWAHRARSRPSSRTRRRP